MMLKQFTAAALTLALCVPAFAEDAPNSDTVVTTVNGQDITLGHMAAARSGLPQQYLQLPDDVLYKAILDQLVNQTVLADTLKGELPKSVQRRLDNERRSLAASVMIEQIADEKLTDEALKAAYEEKYANANPEKEYDAAHILVESEEKAKELAEKAKGGADFAELAREHSTGPSGPNGGALGWFGKGMMVAPFEEAVMGIEEGGISEPVQTQFGWHVIKLNETRLKDKPTFDEVKAELEGELFNEVIDEEVARLKAAADVQTSTLEIDPAILKDDTLLTE